MIKKLSPLWVTLAGILWGAMGLFVRKFNTFGVEAMSVVFIRSLFTAIIAALVCLVYDRRLLKIRFRDVWIFAGMGVLSIVFFNYCYFTAINLMSLSAAAILLYTSPVFVSVFSALFFKERITGKRVISIILSIAGLAFVTGIIGGGTAVTYSGILYGIGSAIGYALYSIFNRAAINRGYGALTTIFYGFSFSAICSAFLADFNSIGKMISTDPSMLPYSVLFSLMISVLPYFLYAIGLKGMENSKAAVIASIEPVSASLIGLFVFHEAPTVLAVFGIILVLLSIVMSIDLNRSAVQVRSPQKQRYQ